MMKQSRGITLIALIVTVIILLILAGITIMELTGNGLLNNAKRAKEETIKQEATETMNLKLTNIQISSYINNNELPNLQFVANELCKDQEVESVKVKDKEVGSTEDGYILPAITVGEEDSIIAKLKAYPYEFEIDSSLRLASIDGVKVSEGLGVPNIKSKVYITDVKSSSFIIHVEAEEPDNVALYQYFIDGKMIAQTYQNSYKVVELKSATPYNVEVKVIPKTAVSIGILKQITADTPEVQLANKFDKYIYIDANSGDDSTGDGTRQAPYKTLDKIADSGIIENGYSYGIVLKNGEYELTTKMFELNCNKEINIIGNRQNTRLKVKDLYKNSSGGTSGYGVNFYRLIWNATDASTNTICLISNPIKICNVAFSFTFSDNNVPGGYFVNLNLYMKNCTVNKKFYGSRVGWTEAECGFIRCGNNGQTKVINCYGGLKSGYSTNDSYWNYQTNYITTEPKVDATTYRITDTESIWKNVGTGNDLDDTIADLGVYGGEYSWEYEDNIGF